MATTEWYRLRATIKEIGEHMDKSLEENDNIISNDLYNQELIWILDKLYADDALEAIEIKNEEKENS